MKQRIVSMILVVLVLFSMTTVYAATDDIKIIVNGEKIAMDAKPFIRNGRTFVPIRFVSEALDGEVDWDSVTKKIVIKKAGKEINIWIGLIKSVIGSIVKNDMDEAPILKDGRTFVPLRFVAENLDCTVDWNGSTRTVTITAKDYVAEEPKEEVINTIESLGLETEPISNYGKVFVDPKGYYTQKEVVIIKKSHFPLQIGSQSYMQYKDIQVSSNRKEITLISKSIRLNGEVATSGGGFRFATKKDGIRRGRNAQKEEKLSDGSIKGWFEVVAYTDDRIDPNFKNFTLDSVEYIVFAREDLDYLVALPISEVLK